MRKCREARDASEGDARECSRSLLQPHVAAASAVRLPLCRRFARSALALSFVCCAAAVSEWDTASPQPHRRTPPLRSAAAVPLVMTNVEHSHVCGSHSTQRRDRSLTALHTAGCGLRLLRPPAPCQPPHLLCGPACPQGARLASRPSARPDRRHCRQSTSRLPSRLLFLSPPNCRCPLPPPSRPLRS